MSQRRAGSRSSSRSRLKTAEAQQPERPSLGVAFNASAQEILIDVESAQGKKLLAQLESPDDEPLEIVVDSATWEHIVAMSQVQTVAAMTVAELRSALRERGLETDGRKSDLVGRLEAAVEADDGEYVDMGVGVAIGFDDENSMEAAAAGGSEGFALQSPTSTRDQVSEVSVNCNYCH